MGRTATVNKTLPPGLRKKLTAAGNTYYYYDQGGKPRKWVPLGANYIDALRQYAELEQTKTARTRADAFTFWDVAQRYALEVIPTKAPRSQIDNHLQLKKLELFFNNPPMPMLAVEPIHVRQYLQWRKAAPRRANLEIALFSHIFNMAREWGYTNAANPCAGVRKFKTPGRSNYVTDEKYAAVWQAACQPLRDALDLAYLTGQRPADVLKMANHHLDGGYLHVQQNKTGAKIRIIIEGELADLLARIAERKATHTVFTGALIVNEHGKAVSKETLRSRFDKARTAAGVAIEAFQFRDLRAKAATDKENSGGMEAAQNQLGHTTPTMTRDYVRNRLGKIVGATK